MVHKGSCLCGGVTFEVMGDLPAPVACHCTQCRKQSGHYWAATDVTREQLTVAGEEHVTYYSASLGIRRGFCGICGTFLFWEPLGTGKMDVAMGAFDTATETKLSKHIFVADKGDYYDIADGLPEEN